MATDRPTPDAGDEPMTPAMSGDTVEPQAGATEEAGPVAVRGDNRIPWMRDDIELFVEHPGGTSVSLPAATSDIGRTGLGVTTHTFLHIGTRTRIRLPALDGTPLDARGEVRWCKYDDGLHHCGIRFLDRIRLDRVVPRDQWTEAMLHDDSDQIRGKVVHLYSSPLDQHMVALALRDTQIRVTAVESPGAVLDAVRNGDTEALVIDLRHDALDLEKFHGQLGQAGYGACIVFVADIDDEVVAGKCYFGEPNAVLRAPMEGPTIASRLTEVLQEWQRLSGGEDALVTRLRRDDSISTMLDGYHDACRNAAEAIRAKLQRDDIPGTLGLLRRIAGTAGTFGYPVLAKQADAAVQKIEKSGALPAAGKEIAQVRSILRNLRGFERREEAA